MAEVIPSEGMKQYWLQQLADVPRMRYSPNFKPGSFECWRPGDRISVHPAVPNYGGMAGTVMELLPRGGYRVEIDGPRSIIVSLHGQAMGPANG